MSQKSTGKYIGNVCAGVAMDGGKPAATVLVVCWFLFPIVVQSVLHPYDVAGLGYWLEGQSVPRYYTPAEVTAGELKALVAFVMLCSITYLSTRLFLANAGFTMALWPVAGFLVGVLGNIGWWFHSAPSPSGVLSGLAALALSVTCEATIEYFAKDGAFGKGRRPQRA